MPIALSGHAASYTTALVTGASSGIGQAITTRLLKAGLIVYGTSRHPGSPDLDPDIRWLGFEGATSEGIAGFVSENQELLIEIDILVNNAGSSSFGRESSIPHDVKIAQKNLLLEAPVQLSRTALEGMTSRGFGAVANISSLAAIFPLPYMEGYSTAKAALSSFSQELIEKWKSSGITILDFQAGDFHTAFNANIRRFGEMDSAQEKVWHRLEENLAKAPSPGKAAEDLIHALERGESRTVRSGGFFQSRIAPLGARYLPRSILMSMIRRYYNLPTR